MPDSSYEEIPFVGVPVAEAHPERLAWTSFIFGGPAVSTDGPLRVLEIGCGDGATLLSMAAYHPEWQVCGIDSSRVAIAAADRSAKECGLTNATFRRGNLARVPIEPKAWDVVLAHGVYSWVDARHRTALRRLLREALTQNGLAYVSFNAQPGWSVRGRIRDILIRNDSADPVNLANQMKAHTNDQPWGRLLADELSRVAEGRPDYIKHEYLSTNNQAFWLGDFIDEMNANGLSWIGDAQFDRSSGRPYETLRKRVEETGLVSDPIRIDELSDLIGYRQFRCAVLCRDDATRQPAATDADILRHARFFGRFACADESVDLENGREQIFQSGDGIDVVIADPLCKAAVIVLTRCYPDALRVDELTAAAESLLQEHAAAVRPQSRNTLEQGLLALWRSGGMEARLRPAKLRVERSRTPAIQPITLHEAAHRPMLSCPLGTPLPASPDERRLIGRLNGRRTETELIAEFEKNLPDAIPFVESRLETFARFGLLRAQKSPST